VLADRLNKFARQKVAPFTKPGDPFPPFCPKYAEWRKNNPLPPYEPPKHESDEDLPYWDRSFKTMTKEEAKAEYEKVMKESEARKKEEQLHPP